jgi:hypothetical protein
VEEVEVKVEEEAEGWVVPMRPVSAESVHVPSAVGKCHT